MKRKAKNSQTGPFDEENYRAIFESIHEGFCIYEVIYDSGKPVDLRWIEVNPAYAKQTGLTDVVGKLHSELGLATEQYWFDIYDQVARTGEAVHFENWHEPTARWYHVFTSRISGVQSRQVAVLFEDITERKEHEERQAFLLRFSDLLRAQPDEQSIKEQTVSMLGEHLRADRCYISEVFEQQGFSTVGPEHIRRADIPPMTGVYQLSDYPETMRQLATQPMVVHDAANDPRFSESEKALLAGLPQQALLVAPLRKGPREVIWALVAAMATPRHWTEAERVLLEEVGERTWAAIERARAEEALRASEEKFRTIFETIDEGFAIVELERDESGNVKDIIYREVNESFERYSGLTNAVGGRASDLLPNLEQSIIDAIQTVADTGEPHRMEIHVADLDRWFNIIYSRVGGAGSPFIAGVFDDITERKQREWQQALLLKLSDALQSLTDAGAIQDTAARVLGEHLGVSRAMYAEVEGEPGFEVGTLRGQYHAADQALPPFPGQYSYDTYGEHIMALRRRGEAMVVVDVTQDPRFDVAERAAWVAGGVRAAITVSLVKAGHFVVDFGVQSADPRQWTAIEVALVKETAERTWAAVERAKAERALRESEEKYRTLFDSIDEGYCLIEMIYDDVGKPVDWLFLEANPTFERQSGLFARGKTVTELLGVADPFWLEAYARVVETGEPERIENRVESTDRWYDIFASRVGGPDSRKLAVVFDDITERKQYEQQQEFLLKFSDTLRAEPDADAVANRALQMMFEHLRLDRCYVGVYKLAEDRGDFPYQWGNDRVPPLPSGVRLSDFPDALQVAFDRTLVIDDVATSESMSDTDRRSFDAIGLRALIVVTLRKGGNNPLWSIVAVSASPRRWTQSEIALLEEVTERTWTAIERARTEEALQKNQRQLLLLNDSLEQKVHEKTTQLQTLASELTRAEQRERDRISHILHDDLQQHIYSVLMQFSTLRNRVSAQDETTRQEAINLEMQMREVLKVARNLSIELNPPILPGEGLLHAIQWLAGQMLERYSLPVDVQADDSVVLSDHELHVLLFNCVRELLFNVVKHANASHAAVRLQKTDGNLHIEVRDNGKGFSTNLPWQMGNQTIALEENLPLSFGLSTIGHKLSLYGGTMEITSKVGEGTKITLVVPVAKNGSD